MEKKPDKNEKMSVINIGLQRFYESLTAQDVDAIQLNWTPPVKSSAKIQGLLDEFL
jgi:hypothetical protein